MKRYQATLALCTLLLVPAFTFGIVWDGDTSTSWTLDGNWVDGTAPACSDTATLNNNGVTFNPKLFALAEIDYFETSDGEDGDRIKLNLNGNTLKVITQWTVGDSSSTDQSYVEIKNGNAAAGSVEVTTFVINGPSSGNNTTILEANPNVGDVTIVTSTPSCS